YLFQPDGLPDATGRRIQDPLRFQRLLSFWIVAFVRWIPYGNDQLIGALSKLVRNIQGKFLVPALMHPGFLAVDKDCRLKIHRPEMQEVASSRFLIRKIKASTVPQTLIR